MRHFSLISLLLWVSSSAAFGQDVSPVLARFSAVYEQELGSVSPCKTSSENVFRVCSDALKNDGNAPYILYHNQPVEKVVVLFHGLSDSPYFLKTIAEAIYQQGHNVVVGLLPGHGKKDADADMEDANLAHRWYQHVEKIIQLSTPLGTKHYVGGFSTGGSLATHYALQHSQELNGLLLFSGALQLSSSVEKLSRIWGIGMLTNWMDGDYQTIGPNPYKYPSVASHSAVMLMDVIFDIRQMEQQQSLNLPIFAAHSKADATTMFSGIEDLMAHNKGPNELFAIDEAVNVCHADVVIGAQQLIDMHFDASQVTEPEPCSIPKANPKHAEMLAATIAFLQQY